MALPPAFLDDLRSRIVLSDIVGRKVTWNRGRSNPSKGDFWAPCPFHQEKTASFHADDRKGFYYCFGCHKKGDAITFVMETENLPFMEAVARLAEHAGIELPARTHDPQAAERRDRHSRMVDVMEQAVRSFRQALNAAAGQPVRAYLQQRGLSAEIQTTFELGAAPDSRTALTQLFTERGQLDEAIAAGLVIRPEDGGTPYDRFRNRLMFPIRDPRGRCIAFGGRAMSDQARAKYLNSPETELFHKSRVLYNHGPAREAAGDLIVAEGYMDVIALTQAGFARTVAPLGTAITADQLGLMWRIADEPVIALDGDAAGLRAAHRLIDLALPVLTPGKSLRFCLLPEGRDPDDLIRSDGAAAMQAVIDAAVPLIELFWRRETGDAPSLDTPERKAAFDARLRAALNAIADPSVRAHYDADLKARRRALFSPAPRPATQAWAKGGRSPGPARPVPQTRRSDLARTGPSGAAEARIREATILLIGWHNPVACTALEGPLETMPILTAEFEPVRARLLDRRIPAAADPPPPVIGKIPQAGAHPFAREGQDPDRAQTVLSEAISRHATQIAYETETAEAAREFANAETEAWCERLRQAANERARASTDMVSEDHEREVEDAPSRLQQMLDREVWRRPTRPRLGGSKKT